MKAILGNFTKISETEFRLKKNLQFADVSLDESHNIETVRYQDKQSIEVGDILTHEDRDYEIKSMNSDTDTHILVKVVTVEQPYVEKPKPKFKARKMTPPKPRPKPIPEPIPEPIPVEIEEPNLKLEKQDLIIDDLEETVTKVDTKPESTPIIPKEKSIFKRFISYLGNKLTNYSDS